jgi:hypothetical protein
VTFIALSGDSRPHFTTISHFVSTLGDQIAPIFAAVLAVCDRQGLIGREMFAIDGVKLPSNASKHRSGTRADFERQAEKMARAAEAMLTRHRAEDARAVEPTLSTKDRARVERLQADAAELRTWLTRHPADRRGAKGAVRKSNRTDNESAKMATSKGVIQGYTGVATVDQAHQIIVDAQAHGTGAEQELLVPVVMATAVLRTPETLITADAGYHSETHLQALALAAVPALIADNNMRQRDARFATQERYTRLPNPLHDKSRPTQKSASVFTPEDFRYDPIARTCFCPAGRSLYRKGASNITRDHIGEHFRGAKRDGGPCPLRAQCLRTPDTTPVRNVAFFRDRVGRRVNYSALMREQIDSATGRAQYAQRFATWSRCSPIYAPTSDSIASRYAGASKLTRNGSCTASCTTSKSSRRAVTLHETMARRTALRRLQRPINANFTIHSLGVTSRIGSLALKRTRIFENALSYSFNAALCCSDSQQIAVNGGAPAPQLRGAPHRRCRQQRNVMRRRLPQAPTHAAHAGASKSQHVTRRRDR